MSRPTYYSPAIERFLVSVLYHEARHRNIPMTRLANQILKAGLAKARPTEAVRFFPETKLRVQSDMMAPFLD